MCAFYKGIAAPISSKEAIKIASDFYFSQHSHATFAKSATSSSSPALTIAYACRPQTTPTRASSQSEEAYYYIINIGKGDGYIIVSGDDRAKQILGYCYNGEFNTANPSPALISWLSGYEKELKAIMSTNDSELAKDNTSLAKDATQTESVYPSTMIAPLVQTKWNQSDPYNRHCPMTVDTNSGQTLRSVVGCTAIGLAQVMKYHEWPVKPMGNIQYGDRSWDFDIQPDFDWAHMLNEYKANEYTDEEADAVARLCANGAYACKMNFSPTGSGSYIIDAGIALSKYFGYDPNTYVYDSNYHSQKEWIDLIMEELNAKRPILYTGFNNNGGHVFVCDGYDGNGYFHFNWGWSGNSDGYYALTALDPSQQGIGSTEGSYTFGQLMICHIQRPGASVSVPQQKKVYLCSDSKLSYQKATEGGNTTETIDGTNITTPKGANINVESWFDRESTSDIFTGIVLGYMKDGTLHELSDVYYAKCSAGPWTYKLSRTIKTAGLAERTYEIGWYQRCAATQEELLAKNNWSRMTAANGKPDAIELTIRGDQQTLRLLPKDFHIALSKDIALAPYYAGEPKTIFFPIKNIGEVRLEGRMGFKIQKVGGTEASYSSVLSYCYPQAEANIPVKLNIPNAQVGEQYTVTPICCGTNSISIDLSEENSVALGEPQTITIQRIPNISSWAPSNTSYVLDGTNKTISIIINQSSKLNPWSGKVYGKIYRKTTQGEYEDTGIEAWSDELAFPNKEMRTVNLNVSDTERLSTDETYKLITYIHDGYGSDGYGTSLDEQPLILNNMPTGIQQMRFTEDGTISIYRLDGECIAKDIKSHAIPTLRAGVYIIKVKTATSITSKKIIIK